MKTVSYTTARNNLATTMDKVCEANAPVIITRNKSASVVMLSLADYEGLQETAYLLQSPQNAHRLMQSIEQIESGQGKERQLIE